MDVCFAAERSDDGGGDLRRYPDCNRKYGYTFELGRAKMLREGADAVLLSTGLMTMRVLEASRKRGWLVIVAENHMVVNGGPGEGVARTLLNEGIAPKFYHIALPDGFLESGALPTLHDRYGLSVNAVCASGKGWLGGGTEEDALLAVTALVISDAGKNWDRAGVPRMTPLPGGVRRTMMPVVVFISVVAVYFLWLGIFPEEHPAQEQWTTIFPEKESRVSTIARRTAWG